ncbi:hypothetical protein CSKR_102904 [Clonorchis sinensis]|uniref:Uncharacterized protein n=1 Tax=Clonorchis sinensis TaxID=79923 RepID=A0A419Q302_CLOSI|nr:hypothetical protein CSKR_102904 [Clonorchis sinensis]
MTCATKKYSFQACPVVVARELNNTRIKEVLLNTGCELSVQARVLNPLYQATPWTKGTIVELTGRDEPSIDYCNQLIDVVSPFYTTRKIYHEALFSQKGRNLGGDQKSFPFSSYESASCFPEEVQRTRGSSVPQKRLSGGLKIERLGSSVSQAKHPQERPLLSTVSRSSQHSISVADPTYSLGSRTLFNQLKRVLMASRHSPVETVHHNKHNVFTTSSATDKKNVDLSRFTGQSTNCPKPAPSEESHQKRSSSKGIATQPDRRNVQILDQSKSVDRVLTALTRNLQRFKSGVEQPREFVFNPKQNPISGNVLGGKKTVIAADKQNRNATGRQPPIRTQYPTQCSSMQKRASVCSQQMDLKDERTAKNEVKEASQKASEECLNRPEVRPPKVSNSPKHHHIMNADDMATAPKDDIDDELMVKGDSNPILSTHKFPNNRSVEQCSAKTEHILTEAESDDFRQDFINYGESSYPSGSILSSPPCSSPYLGPKLLVYSTSLGGNSPENRPKEAFKSTQLALVSDVSKVHSRNAEVPKTSSGPFVVPNLIYSQRLLLPGGMRNSQLHRQHLSQAALYELVLESTSHASKQNTLGSRKHVIPTIVPDYPIATLAKGPQQKFSLQFTQTTLTNELNSIGSEQDFVKPDSLTRSILEGPARAVICDLDVSYGRTQIQRQFRRGQTVTKTTRKPANLTLKSNTVPRRMTSNRSSVLTRPIQQSGFRRSNLAGRSGTRSKSETYERVTTQRVSRRPPTKDWKIETTKTNRVSRSKSLAFDASKDPVLNAYPYKIIATFRKERDGMQKTNDCFQHPFEDNLKPNATHSPETRGTRAVPGCREIGGHSPEYSKVQTRIRVSDVQEGVEFTGTIEPSTQLLSSQLGTSATPNTEDNSNVVDGHHTSQASLSMELVKRGEPMVIVSQSSKEDRKDLKNAKQEVIKPNALPQQVFRRTERSSKIIRKPSTSESTKQNSEKVILNIHDRNIAAGSGTMREDTESGSLSILDKQGVSGNERKVSVRRSQNTVTPTTGDHMLTDHNFHFPLASDLRNDLVDMPSPMREKFCDDLQPKTSQLCERSATTATPDWELVKKHFNQRPSGLTRIIQKCAPFLCPNVGF